MFKINPQDVIDAAAEQDFCRVTVVGVYRNGRLYVASSHGVSTTFADMDKAKAYVDSLTVYEGDDEEPAAEEDEVIYG